MSKKCIGCGATLQYTLPNDIGYSPKFESDYCKRCFRLSNYGEFNSNIIPIIDTHNILNKISNINGIIVWVVDLLDFESCFFDDYHKYFKDKKIIMVLTKFDLLPNTLTSNKVKTYIKERLFDYNLIDIIVKEKNSNILDKLLKYVDVKETIIVLGMANAGKSTLLNSFKVDNLLTISRYPNTTLDFNKFKLQGYNFIDTPGLTQPLNIINYINKEYLKDVIPNSQIKPKVYQLYQPQSYAIGGLCKIDIDTNSNTTIVFYISNQLNIHRGKLENSNDLWLNHYNELLKPTPNITFNEFKTIEFNNLIDSFDIVIFGLGWLTITTNDICNIKIHTHNKVEVIKREVLI